jgi:hypothetical protein
MYGCHIMLCSYHTYTMHSHFIPTQWCYCGVHDLEQDQPCEIRLQSIQFVVIVRNWSIPSTNQGTQILLRKLPPSLIAAKMTSPDQETTPRPICIFATPSHLTYHLQNLRLTLLTSATALHYPWQYIQYSWCLIRDTTFPYPPFNHWAWFRTKQ